MTSTANRLERIVRTLAEPGDRVAGSPRWRAAVTWLDEWMLDLELEPYAGAADYRHPYRVTDPVIAATDLELTNLLGVAPGTRLGGAPLLIGAHVDTVPGSPGADDNAAAIAIALEVTRRLVAAPAERDVVLALFAAEEPPYFHSPDMGSTVFYERQREGAIHAAFVLDLVGHAVPYPMLGNLVFVTGMETDPALERTLTELDPPRSVRIVTALNEYVGDMSDHHAFRLGGTPYLFFSCGRWKHYHAPSDTPEKLDYRKMAGIADVLEATVRDVAERELEGPWEGYDTTETDLAFMRSAMGAQLTLLGMKPTDRAGIERVVARMLGAGL